MARRTSSAAAVATAESNGHVAAPSQAGMTVIIPKIVPQVLSVEIVGVTPLIVCAWSEKARRQMLEKQMGKSLKKKEPKDPVADYNASRYVSTDGWDGLPAGGIKGCLVAACRMVDGLPMTVAKRMLRIRSQGVTEKGQQLVRIYGEPRMHEGMVRLESGVADVRFRAEYPVWSCKLEIEFLQNVISAEQVCNLLELAGWCEGLCEHRKGSPKNCSGDSGSFQIKRAE